MSKSSYRTFAHKRKRQTTRRLKKAAPLFNGNGPILGSGPLRFDTSERIRAIACGGIGAIHTLVNHLGLPAAINDRLELLKVHMPYHESDHVLNIAYNGMLGGTTLQDIELRRNDPAYLDALGTPSIPDPTTAGDFTRRFSRADTLALQEAFNEVRRKVWARQPARFMETAVIDFDGTIATTGACCKQGIDISYKGTWGYHPLITTLANTREVLYVENRPGNAKSSEGFEDHVERAIKLVRPFSQNILLRGDTDFYRAKVLDEWSQQVDFVFGAKAFTNLKAAAEALAEDCWERFERPVYEVDKTAPRRKPENVRGRIVKERGFANLKLRHEDVAEFRYRPTGCTRDYRMVVLRKNISKQKGEAALLEDIRYFFYVTTLEDVPAADVVGLANGRCDQENIIEQAKNGIAALRMPVDSLEANEAYAVMMLLGLSIKSWLGLLMPHRASGLEVVRMEYRRFLHQLIMIPAQVVRSARQTTLRFLASNDWLLRLCSTWERLLAPG